MRILVLLFLFAISSLSAQKSVDKFIDNHLKHKSVKALNLPGWLFRMSAKFTDKMDDEGDIQTYTEVGRHVKNLRVLWSESKLDIDQDEILHMLAELTEKDSYEALLQAKDSESNVQIFMKEEDDIVQGLIFLIHQEDGFGIASLKLKLPLELFNEIQRKNKKTTI